MQIKFYKSILFALLVTASTTFAGTSANPDRQVAAPEATETESPADKNKLEPAAEDRDVLESCEVKTDNFIDVANRVKAEIDQHGAENVLLSLIHI